MNRFANKKTNIMIILAVTLIFTLGALVPQIQKVYAEDQTRVFTKVNQTRYTKKTTWLYKTIAPELVKGVKLKKSLKVKVMGKSQDGWDQVTYKKKTYYVQDKFLSKDNGYLVVIDAGHQKKGNSKKEPIGPGAKTKKAKVSSGATGKYTKIPEYKLTLVMAKKLS